MTVYSCCLIIIHLYIFCIKNIVSQISMVLPSRRHLKICVDVLPCLLIQSKLPQMSIHTNKTILN